MFTLDDYKKNTHKLNPFTLIAFTLSGRANPLHQPSIETMYIHTQREQQGTHAIFSNDYIFDFSWSFNAPHGSRERRVAHSGVIYELSYGSVSQLMVYILYICLGTGGLIASAHAILFNPLPKHFL